MRPGVSHLAQDPGQEHERSEQHPDTADNELRHSEPGSIRALRLSITERPRLGTMRICGVLGTERPDPE
jgi:hypothetical protein